MTTATPAPALVAEGHIDPAAAFVPVQTRSERPSSFEPADFGVPTGREEEWRFTPLHRLRHLHEDAPAGDGGVSVRVDAAPEVEVETVARDDARADRVDPRLLGSGDDVVHLPQLRRRLAEGHGPGHVGVVAVDHRAEVHLDHVAFGERAVTRMVVRLGGVLAEGDDRLERECVGAVSP